MGGLGVSHPTYTLDPVCEGRINHGGQLRVLGRMVGKTPNQETDAKLPTTMDEYTFCSATPGTCVQALMATAASNSSRLVYSPCLDRMDYFSPRAPHMLGVRDPDNSSWSHLRWVEFGRPGRSGQEVNVRARQACQCWMFCHLHCLVNMGQTSRAMGRVEKKVGSMLATAGP